MLVDQTVTPTQAAVEQTARDWYRALDEHVPLAEALDFLVDDGLEMRLPEGVSRGHAGFTAWYETVTRRFFDEVHTVTSVVTRPDPSDPAAADVDVVVNWQARVWDPPEPRSRWLGFDAYQTWRVVGGPSDGRPARVRIAVYAVDRLVPMPGSASL